MVEFAHVNILSKVLNHAASIRHEKLRVKNVMQHAQSYLKPGLYVVGTNIASKVGAKQPELLQESKGNAFRHNTLPIRLLKSLFTNAIPPSIAIVKPHPNDSLRPMLQSEHMLATFEGTPKFFSTDEQRTAILLANDKQFQQHKSHYDTLRRFLPIIPTEFDADSNSVIEPLLTGEHFGNTPQTMQENFIAEILESIHQYCPTATALDRSTNPQNIIQDYQSALNKNNIHFPSQVPIEELSNLFDKTPFIQMHMDMKSENILNTGTNWAIIDFGFSSKAPFFYDPMSLAAHSAVHGNQAHLIQSFWKGSLGSKLDEITKKHIGISYLQNRALFWTAYLVVYEHHHLCVRPTYNLESLRKVRSYLQAKAFL